MSGLSRISNGSLELGFWEDTGSLLFVSMKEFCEEGIGILLITLKIELFRLTLGALPDWSPRTEIFYKNFFCRYLERENGHSMISKNLKEGTTIYKVL